MPHDSVTNIAAQEDTNRDVIAAIRAHHSELAAELDARTKAVLGAADNGDCSAARTRLHEWYSTALLPHIVAEEQALYSPASELDATRLLVRGMLAEHRALVALIADLALAQRPFDVAIITACAQALFNVHVDKENDLLLPALNSTGLDLAAALDGMHEILGPAEPTQGHGCGCGCEHSGESATAVPVQLTPSRPAEVPPPPTHETTLSSTSDSADLDVRALPHGQRHEIIFSKLDALGPGDALVIVNDHDPKPLRYQTEALWPDRFGWTYLQAGPERWRLAIRRVG